MLNFFKGLFETIAYVSFSILALVGTVYGSVHILKILGELEYACKFIGG